MQQMTRPMYTSSEHQSSEKRSDDGSHLYREMDLPIIVKDRKSSLSPSWIVKKRVRENAMSIMPRRKMQ